MRGKTYASSSAGGSVRGNGDAEGGWHRTAQRWCACRMKRQRVTRMLVMTPLFIIVIVYVQLVLLTWQHTSALEKVRRHVKAENDIRIAQMTSGARAERTKALRMRANVSSTTFSCVWFTTLKADVSRQFVQRNVILNRAKLLTSKMQPVLFVSDYRSAAVNENYGEAGIDNAHAQLEEALVATALENGWLMYTAPSVNEHGTPFIGDMMRQLMEAGEDGEQQEEQQRQQQLGSPFYGFASDDVLFDSSLAMTLAAIFAQMTSLPFGPLLVVGLRTDYRTTDTRVRIDEVYWVEQLRRRSSMFRLDKLEYFFFTADFPRHLFDDLVVGRAGYISYLVTMATRLNITVIDVTNTVTALHVQLVADAALHGSDVDKVPAVPADASYNLDIIGGDFDYGQTCSAHMETYYDIDNLNIRLRPNTRPPGDCKSDKNRP